jgi:hypothetical protein
MPADPYKRFCEAYGVPSAGLDFGLAAGGTRELFAAIGGRTFGEGIYRVHTADSCKTGTAMARKCFPKATPGFTCFGFDWLGRQFALSSPGRDEPDHVLMLEPGTGQVLEIPYALAAFHDQGLVDFKDACLADNFFAAWVAGGGKCPGFHQCVGYRVPLFLGGRDDVSNLEVTDFEVYWNLAAQLLAARDDLPPGTPVTGVSIS